jgi:uncharacterized protein (TIGR00266 family)
VKYKIDHQPSYAMATVLLEPGQSIRCESGAMVGMSSSLKIEANLNGDKNSSGIGKFFGAAKRSLLGGEGLFITTVKAIDKTGEVSLAPSTPGDLASINLTPRRGLIIQRGSYLASGSGIDLDTKWGGLKGLVGGEGLFFLKATGEGVVFINSFGAVHKKILDVGENYIVDSGHLVAYLEGMRMTTRMISDKENFFKRAMTSMTTGEGLVMEFSGPGEIYIQTRNPVAFGEWISELLPSSGGSSSSSSLSSGSQALDAIGSFFDSGD